MDQSENNHDPAAQGQLVNPYVGVGGSRDLILAPMQPRQVPPLWQMSTLTGEAIRVDVIHTLMRMQEEQERVFLTRMEAGRLASEAQNGFDRVQGALDLLVDQRNRQDQQVSEFARKVREELEHQYHLNQVVAQNTRKLADETIRQQTEFAKIYTQMTELRQELVHTKLMLQQTQQSATAAQATLAQVQAQAQIVSASVTGAEGGVRW